MQSHYIFIPHRQVPPQQQQPPPQQQAPPPAGGAAPPAANTQLAESEFDEIMTRNRNVSSSAISRAVMDASAGN